MNCTDFRNHLLAEPAARSADMLAHADDCPACAQFAQVMQSMDRDLLAAMEIEIPANLGQTVLLQKIAQRRRRMVGMYALAASVLVGVGLAAGLFVGRATAPVPAALLAHVAHEPQLLEPSNDTVSIQRVSEVLREGNVRLHGDIPTVSHAVLCPFRGNLVPHLVVNAQNGPVTIMLLPNETIERSTPFEEGNMKGILVPVGRGSIAIIGTDPAQFESLNRQFSQAVEYSI